MTRYTAAIEGKDATVTFTRSGDAILDLQVSRMKIDCLPIAEGRATTREVTATIPELTVKAGAVDGVAKDEPYAPAITGAFTPDGRFAATISFSGIKGGYSCGGEYPFTASPA